jgi:ABC-type transport system involved in cytochrome bd biosynthesis fused ATPase/permease subunit
MPDSKFIHKLRFMCARVLCCCRLGDKDFKDLDVAHLRKHIGIVSQEPNLFDMTIAENIRFGKPDATQEEVCLYICVFVVEDIHLVFV